MTQLKPCPFCGHQAAQIFTQLNAGAGGAPRHRVACHQCGALSDFFDEFVHGKNSVSTIEKATKAWNRRSRMARSEELADHVAKLRSLTKTISAGCKAKTKAAEEARACVKQFEEDIDMILHHAKSHQYVELDVNRATR